VRPGRKLAGAVLATAGLAAVADAGLTVVWQEPVGALRASAAQDDLGERYEELTTRFARARVLSARSTMLERARAARRLDETTEPGEPLGRLSIPRLDLERVWVDGTDADALEKAPGHYDGTVLPGRRGTVGIAGHRSTHGAPFRHVDKLDPGDRIELTMPYGRFEYAVERTRIVSPEQAEVLRAARSDRLVLTACHPVWSAKQRIVVIARLVRWPGMLRAAPLMTHAPAGRSLRQARARLADAPALTGTPRRTS
jgi:sortase A